MARYAGEARGGSDLDAVLAGRAFPSGTLPADAVERVRRRHAEAAHTEALRAVFADVARAA